MLPKNVILLLASLLHHTFSAVITGRESMNDVDHFPEISDYETSDYLTRNSVNTPNQSSTIAQLSECKEKWMEQLGSLIGKDEILSVLEFHVKSIEQAMINITHMPNELCELAIEQAYTKILRERWTQSAERYVMKTWLEGGLVPCLQAINLLCLLFLELPIFFQLSHANSDLAVWHFMLTCSSIVLVHSLIFKLPNIVIRLMLVCGADPNWSRYVRPENYGAVACPMFMFADQLLSQLPNWILVVALWDQLFRARKQIKRVTDGSTVGFSGSNSLRMQQVVTVKSHRISKMEANRQQPSTSVSRNYACQRTQEVKTRGSTTISTENALINDGLTKFGAQIVTVTLLVIHVFSNVHSLWLHTLVEGRCMIDRENHAVIFTVVYPYFIWTIHQILPDSAYFLGMFYFGRLMYQRRKRMISCSDAARPQSQPFLDANLCQLTGSSAHSESMHFKRNLKDSVSNIPSKNTPAPDVHTVFVHQCRSCILQVQIHSQRFCKQKFFTVGRPSGLTSTKSSYSGSDVLEQSVLNSNGLLVSRTSDLYLLVMIAISSLIFKMPQDIEWLYARMVHDLYFPKNLDVIKVWQLIECVIGLWALLGQTLLMPMALCVSSTVRSCLHRLYCYRKIRCLRHSWHWCCCGFYCNIQEQSIRS
ncbi:hypothetical protein EG68_00306 [Paragonimus skrjabini miyazakii]|uniref:G-protein coupled receptors family 1 profile domain-containing protein n=1 Tax=Paragonimus skrjabini miyazakii TaxID=59628 RepID=A0A8S9Z4J3_9TREM|nr:hypothetical protein EG68_00306 [Paragonimus skrjabini miyazakii]